MKYIRKSILKAMLFFYWLIMLITFPIAKLYYIALTYKLDFYWSDWSPTAKKLITPKYSNSYYKEIQLKTPKETLTYLLNLSDNA